jgi:hypothetical protein
MPLFEMEANGKRYQVEAPDPQTAASSLQGHTGHAPSMVEGLGRAAARGVPIVGGALNKLEAATNAALAPALNRLFDEKDQLQEPTFGGRYEHSLRDQEGKDKAFETEHPIANAVAEIGGGIASMGGAAATQVGSKLLGLTAKTLPGMMVRGGVSGGIIDATDAAVRGENPVAAGAGGALISAVAPAAGRLVNAKVIEPVRNLLRGFHDPAGEAERRVASALDRDIRNKDRGLTLQEMTTAHAEGQPAALIDAGGETTRALARSRPPTPRRKAAPTSTG